jgi:hypothetical protein
MSTNGKRFAKAGSAVLVTVLLAAAVFTIVPSAIAPLAALIAIPATLMLIATSFEKSESAFDLPEPRRSSAF